MHITGTQIREEGGESPAVRVDLCGDGGEFVSVFMRRSEGLNRDNAILRARSLMARLADATEKQGGSAHAS